MTYKNTYYVIRVGKLGCIREELNGIYFTGDISYATSYITKEECISFINTLHDIWKNNSRVIKISRETKEI